MILLKELKEEITKYKILNNELQEILLHIKKTSNINYLWDISLSQKEVDVFFNIVKKYKLKNIPLNYLLKTKYFYNSNFYVDKNVLIPRKETELLVEKLLSFNLKNKVIADICCGSGCIGLSIKKEIPEAKVLLFDISKKTLTVTNKNAKNLNLEVEIIKSNFLNYIINNNIELDFIISNPPYIDKKDLYIDQIVKKHEPRKALFAKKEGLYFYELLFQNLDNLYNINPNLIIIFEFGFLQKDKIEKLFNLKRVKYNIDFEKDYSNNWRYFIISSNKEN